MRYTVSQRLPEGRQVGWAGRALTGSLAKLPGVNLPISREEQVRVPSVNNTPGSENPTFCMCGLQTFLKPHGTVSTHRTPMNKIKERLLWELVPMNVPEIRARRTEL